MPLHIVTIWHDIAYTTAVTNAEYKSECEPTKDTTYLALMVEVWGVFCRDFQENWLRFNGTALYQGATSCQYINGGHHIVHYFQFQGHM